MKLRVKSGSKVALVVGVLVVAASAASTLAFPPRPGPGSGCPRRGIYCLDVWQPVICSNGQVYSNSCYAYVACATGCVPYGGETE